MKITALLLAAGCMCLSISAAHAVSLPHQLYSQAVSEQQTYDPEFDYAKLGRVSALPRGTSRHARRNLIDEVVVNKSMHRMQLMRNHKVVRSYWIALSNRPQGKKQFKGDKRTPEGRYTLDYVKENSSFYKAFHISYPNPDDIRYARSQGRHPGGLIMVHGQPPVGKKGSPRNVQRSDWTNGCIALMNDEMDEFLSLVDPGTPITINP